MCFTLEVVPIIKCISTRSMYRTRGIKPSFVVLISKSAFYQIPFRLGLSAQLLLRCVFSDHAQVCLILNFPFWIHLSNRWRQFQPFFFSDIRSPHPSSSKSPPISASSVPRSYASLWQVHTQSHLDLGARY